MNNTGDINVITLGALQASLSSKTGKAERQQCEKFIQDLKSQKECMNVMSLILKEDESICNEYVKLLALSILNDWTKLWWVRVNANDRETIRLLSLELLSSTLSEHPNKAIRTKLAVFLSTIAENMFPQYWPNMMQQLLSMWMAFPFSKQTVVLMTLETIIVDCIDADFNSALSTLRRQDIVSGLVEAQQPLFDTSYKCLLYCMQEYSKLQVAGK